MPPITCSLHTCVHRSAKLTTVIRDAAKHHPLLMWRVRRSQSAEPAIQSIDNMMSAIEKTKIGCTLGLSTRLLYMAEKMIDTAPRKLRNVHKIQTE